MYVKIIDGAVDQFPYTIESLRGDNPNTSFPKNPSDELLEGFGVYAVNPVPRPSFDIRTQTVAQNDEPHLEDGQWFIGWTITDKTADEITAHDTAEGEIMRLRRNELLEKSDWTQVSDSPLSDTDKAAWATYRQSLRDISSQEGFPNSITWPTSP